MKEETKPLKCLDDIRLALIATEGLTDADKIKGIRYINQRLIMNKKDLIKKLKHSKLPFTLTLNEIDYNSVAIPSKIKILGILATLL